MKSLNLGWGSTEINFYFTERLALELLIALHCKAFKNAFGPKSRNERDEMADKLKAIGVLNSLQIKDVNKLKDENENLKKKNERLIHANKEWTKHGDDLKKKHEENKKIIEDLKKKNEDKKKVIEDLKSKHDADVLNLKKAKAENENYEIVKNELGGLKEKYESALNEIKKLARFVNLYGKNKIDFKQSRADTGVRVLIRGFTIFPQCHFSKSCLRLLSSDMKYYRFMKSISEQQYVPSEICIRGRTTHWFTYTVQKAVFYLDSFNDEGRPIYAGIQKKMTRVSWQKCNFTEETDTRNQNYIYLTHD